MQRKNKLLINIVEIIICFFVGRYFSEYLFSYFPNFANQPIIYLVFIMIAVNILIWFNKKIGI